MQKISGHDSSYEKQMKAYLQDTEVLKVVFGMMKDKFGDAYDKAFEIFGHYLKCRKDYAWSVIEIFVHAFNKESPPETIKKIIHRLEQHSEIRLQHSVMIEANFEAASQRMFFEIYRDLLHETPTVNID